MELVVMLQDEFQLLINYQADKLSLVVKCGELVKVIEDETRLFLFSGYELSDIAGKHLLNFSDLLSADLDKIKSWLNHADGYFSWALVDKINNQLYLARDKLGCKPVYYSLAGNTILVANRLKSFNNHSAQLAAEALQESLHYRWISNRATLLSNVRQVAACEISQIALAQPHITHHRYYSWKQTFRATTPKGLAILVNEIESCFDQYFQILAPQVSKVLITLSGGVDSSVMAAKAVEHLGDKVVLGLIEFEGDNNPELDMAKYFASTLGVETRIIPFRHQDFAQCYASLTDQLEQLPRHYSSLPFAKLLNHSDEFDGVIYGEPGDTLYGSSTIRRLVKRFGRKKYADAIPSAIANLLNKITSRSVARKLQKLRTDTVSSMFHNADKLRYSEQDQAILNQLKGFGQDSIFIDEVLQLSNDRTFLAAPKSEWLAYLRDYMLITDIVDHMITADHLIKNRKMQIFTPLNYSNVLQQLKYLSPNDYLGTSHVKLLLRELGCKYYSRESMYAPKFGFNTPFKFWVDSQRDSMVEEIQHGTLTSLGYLKNVNQPILASLSVEMLWTLFHLNRFASHFLVKEPNDAVLQLTR
jgi:asparagine synthetase B (glutamine-hydrolysing)